MKIKYYRILSIFALFIISNSGYTQSEEIKIEFLGNCGLHMTDGKTNIYIDFPYKSGAYNYMEFEEAEIDRIKDNSIFIFTHKHRDHYSRRDVKKVLKQKSGKKYGVGNISKLEQLNEKLNEFEIEKFKTEHKFFGIPFRHYSFLITWHGKRIYLSGDTTNPEIISKVENIDWAFVPYWILSKANEQNIEVDAKMFYIYHLYPQQIPSAKENWNNIDHIHPLVEQGEILTLKY